MGMGMLHSSSEVSSSSWFSMSRNSGYSDCGSTIQEYHETEGTFHLKKSLISFTLTLIA